MGSIDLMPAPKRIPRFQAGFPHLRLGIPFAIVTFSLLLAPVAFAGDLEFAHGLYRQKRFDLAADEYAEVLKAPPSESAALEATFFLAECQVQLGRTKEALALFEQLAMSPPAKEKLSAAQRAQLAFRVGQLSFDLRRYADAAEKLAAFLSENADHPLRAQANYLLAEARLETGDVDGASAALDACNIGDDDPLAPRVRLARGKVAEQKSENDAAENVYRDLLARSANAPASAPADPIAIEAALRLGTLLYKRGDFAAAKQVLIDARERAPAAAIAPTLNYQTALCHLQMGENDLARPILEALAGRAEADPLVPQSLYQLVRLGSATSDWTLAQSASERLAKHPEWKDWLDRSRLVQSEAILASAKLEPAGKVKQLEVIAKQAAGTDAQARIAYHAGLAAYQASDWPRASRWLESAVASPDPSLRADAIHALGLTRMKQEQWADAAKLLEESAARTSATLTAWTRALARLPASPEVDAKRAEALQRLRSEKDAGPLLTAAGQDFYSAGQFAWAEKAYRAATETSADPAQSLAAELGLAWSLFELNQKDQAKERFLAAAQKAKEKTDERAEAIVMAGVLAADTNQADEALRQFQQVRLEHPGSRWSEEAAWRSAPILRQMNRLDDADQIYADLAEHAASDARRRQARLERAWLALERADHSAAENQLLSVWNDPEAGALRVESALKLAELWQEGDKLAEARKLLEEAAALPASPTVEPALLYRRGLIEHDLGHAAEAQPFFEQVVARHADSPFATAATFWLGEIAFTSSNSDRSLAHYQQVLERTDASKYAPLARLRMAQCHLKSQRLAEADQAIEELLATDPGPAVREEALYIKARVRQQKSEFDAARSIYQEIIGPERTETAAKAQFMIGETYLLQERYDEAIKEFLKVQILYPIPDWQALALVEIGKCYVGKSDNVKAKQSFEEVLAKYGDQPAAAQAKAQMEMLTASSSPAAP